MMDAPVAPDDMETAALATADCRTTVKDGIVGIIGQNFGEEDSTNHTPIVGTIIAPSQKKPNVYAKTATNVRAAVTERITKKARAPKLTGSDIRRIGRVIRAAMGFDSESDRRGVFSRARIIDWLTRNFNLEEMRSSKWSLARFRSALECLYAKDQPKYMFKASIKPEAMEEGKAPRLLIADGDEGCLMALAVIKCFEDILFDWFEARSIKHCSKREAIERAVKNLTTKGGKSIEGDGSAWDTTCNGLVRGLVENPILRHIMEVLAEAGVIPETWMEEHQKACEDRKLKVFFKTKFESLVVTIDAIRRSGHRGTSCLNWWINFTLWVSSIFVQPERYLDPSVRWGKDLTGVQRWWNGCFEGDDSLCTLSPPMVDGDSLSKIFMDFWRDAGFNMKIVFCKSRATFCGWHVGCDDGALNQHRCPELPRALANSGVSVSPAAIQAYWDGNTRVIKTLAAASALARAADFSGILPTVSRKYLAYANSCSMSNFSDREMSMRVCGEEGMGANQIRAMIEERNLPITPQEEMVTMKGLGYDASHDELLTFSEYVWDLEPATLLAYEEFKASLPAAWRVGA